MGKFNKISKFQLKDKAKYAIEELVKLKSELRDLIKERDQYKQQAEELIKYILKHVVPDEGPNEQATTEEKETVTGDGGDLEQSTKSDVSQSGVHEENTLAGC